MKKIFTLISVALAAMSVHAQTETWSAEELTYEKRWFGEFTKNQLMLTDMTESEGAVAIYSIPKEAHVFEVGTFQEHPDRVPAWLEANNGSQYITGTLKDYIFTVTKENVTLKAVATPNDDAEEFERWQATGYIGEVGTGKWQYTQAELDAIAEEDQKVLIPSQPNLALNTDECSPKWNFYVKPKNGNPSLGYFSYYETPAKSEIVTDANGNEQIVYPRDENGELIPDENGTPIQRKGDATWQIGSTYAPGKGCYYEFDFKKAGSLKMGVWLGRPNSTAVMVVEKSTLAPLAVSSLKFEGFCQNNTYTYLEKGFQEFSFREDYTIDVDNQKSRPLLGYLTFPVEANKSYLVFQPTGQVGIYGFEFTPGEESGISTVKAAAEDADAPVYNLAGQKVDNGYKGIVIQNGVKRIQK